MEEISAISGGVTISRGVLEFLGFIKGVAESNVISALFRSDGSRIEGSEEIVIETHTDDRPDIWWFEVKELEDYTFIRIPTIESCVDELAGSVKGEKNPDARFWRWVVRARQGTIVGGDPPNIKVDFVVVGYRPKALINYFS